MTYNAYQPNPRGQNPNQAHNQNYGPKRNVEEQIVQFTLIPMTYRALTQSTQECASGYMPSKDLTTTIS